MNFKFQADLPYPKVVITEKNRNEVKLLMPVYSGRESEATAIFSYIYGHYVTGDVSGDLSDCLKGIAIAEMRHHALLGETIFYLGGTPYIGGNYNYWQGSYVNYEKDPVRIIKNALSAEKQAIRDYKIVVSRTSVADIKLLIERIILDEEVHIGILTELLETYSSSFCNSGK